MVLPFQELSRDYSKPHTEADESTILGTPDSPSQDSRVLLTELNESRMTIPQKIKLLADIHRLQRRGYGARDGLIMLRISAQTTRGEGLLAASLTAHLNTSRPTA